MILLQETKQTLTFQPMFVDGSPPWYERLFVLYLLVMLIVLLVRGVRLAAGLRKLRKIEKNDPKASALAHDLWNSASFRARSLSKFSLLTFFLSLLIISMEGFDAFHGIRVQMTTVMARRVADFADKLPGFSFGMLVCVILYAFGWFFESRLNHRKAGLEHLRDASPTD